ncbi:MAG: hypothetical protein WCA84_16115 [Ignavibacteriaceae bacterium]
MKHKKILEFYTGVKGGIVKTLIILIIISIFLYLSKCNKNNVFLMKPDIKISFQGDSQIETGGPYVGVEFHHSSSMPQRVSFFYPVANSIDLSSDYWKRDSTFVMSAGIMAGYGTKMWINNLPFSYELTPYGVTFNNSDIDKSIKISYRFCKDKPAMIVGYEITNNSKEAQPFEFYTHFELSLKTSHTYSLKSKAWTEYDSSTQSIYAHFDDPETQNVCVFVANAGIEPESFNTIGTLKNYAYNEDWWYKNYSSLPDLISKKNNQRVPAAEFLYKKNLEPNETMSVVQIIGTSKQNEEKAIVSYLEKSYGKEINNYEKSVLDKVYEGHFITGDTSIDKSYKWAKGILAVNRHYLDYQLVPMPCPAEYNFYYTHDVLVTDYAAVNFDINRVKADLNYIVAHAGKNFIIPHAYYWKDSSYNTEFASSDNWNNFWFILTAGSYLKHSADVYLMRHLYPYLTKCLTQAMLNKNEDNLMWEAHIDGSDLADSYGPRTFMTSLAIESLREYIFISMTIGENQNSLLNYEDLADKMEKALNDKLWDNELGFLVNCYKGGKVDTHYYMGSLIAPHFNLLNRERTEALVNSAMYHLFDTKLGIYNIYPMDLDSLKTFLKLKGDEAGSPFYYADGGIWANSNAWFVLSLIADNKKDEAFNFIKNIMTVDGIIKSPNGQPAMYEYRVSDYNNPLVYGKIDKPQFLWAAGWYIYSLYHLFGINENAWNIAFTPYLSPNMKSSSFTENINGIPVNINITGSGKYIQSIKYDNNKIQSAVIPHNVRVDKIDILLGRPEAPYLAKTNSLLEKCNYDFQKRSLDLVLKAFTGSKIITQIISPFMPQRVYLDADIFNGNLDVTNENGIFILNINSINKAVDEEIRVEF